MVEIVGDNTDEILAGGADADIIDGKGGSDFIVGRNGDDLLKGGGGADFILGGGGADTILGGTGRDTLFGGRGDDDINGGSGGDTLNGDYGADTLTGGSGDDTFVFKSLTAGFDENDNFAWDTITDFEDGDTLSFEDFGGFGFFNFTQVGDDVHVSFSPFIFVDPCLHEGLGGFDGPEEICFDLDIELSDVPPGDIWEPIPVFDIMIVVVEDALAADVETASTIEGFEIFT